MPRASDPASRGRSIGLALAVGLLTGLAGLAAMSVIAASRPDDAFRARVQAWRDLPPTPRPGQP